MCQGVQKLYIQHVWLGLNLVRRIYDECCGKIDLFSVQNRVVHILTWWECFQVYQAEVLFHEICSKVWLFDTKCMTLLRIEQILHNFEDQKFAHVFNLEQVNFRMTLVIWAASCKKVPICSVLSCCHTKRIIHCKHFRSIEFFMKESNLMIIYRILICIDDTCYHTWASHRFSI